MIMHEDKNNCCTLVNLRNLTEYKTLEEYGNGRSWLRSHYYPLDNPEKAYFLFINELKRCVNLFDQNFNNTPPYRFQDRAVVMASSVSRGRGRSEAAKTYRLSEDMLERFGFTRAIGPVKKRKHAENKLSIWLMTTADFLKALEEESKKLEA